MLTNNLWIFFSERTLFLCAILVYGGKCMRRMVIQCRPNKLLINSKWHIRHNRKRLIGLRWTNSYGLEMFFFLFTFLIYSISSISLEIVRWLFGTFHLKAFYAAICSCSLFASSQLPIVKKHLYDVCCFALNIFETIWPETNKKKQRHYQK